MPTSYCHLATHIIFSTADRTRIIQKSREKELYAYIGGIIKNIKGTPIIINGTEDHLHVLCLLPKEMGIADFVKHIKAYSSKWYNEKYHSKFHWQQGYAAYSVSKSNLVAVEKYILNQKEHHKHSSFEDEYNKFLTIHGFEPNEKSLISPPIKGSTESMQST
ncbi:MAG TPA: transposase [Candidatus Cloacimonadota bacterium]|nr:transposase [Candidatus Cloacimonadota bacterium]HPT72737.1 transposase [Candidatus Cloacimonadota bacterium]